MVQMGSGDPFAELKKSYRDYKVFDAHYERIGNVGEVFVDGRDHPLYLGVSTGLLELDSVLIPMDMIRINDKRAVVEVDASRERIENAPSLGSSEEISPDLEDKVRVYYGLKPLHSPDHSPDELHGTTGTTSDPLAVDERIDLVPGEREAAQGPFEGPPPYREREEHLRREEERKASKREAAEHEVRGTNPQRDSAGDRRPDEITPNNKRVRRFAR